MRRKTRQFDRILCGKKFRTNTVSGSEVFPQLAALKSRTSTNNLFL